MDTDQAARTIRAGRRVRYLLPVIMLVLVGGTTFAACGDGHVAGTGPAAGGSQAAAMPAGSGMSAGAMASGAMDDTPTGADDAWAHPPEYTHATASTEAAYEYALYHPQAVQWMPCYCGCAAMGHRSNLDCYIKPATDGPVTFEEHASYCELCVQITLKTRELMAQGASLHGARAAIDALFAGDVPGTATEVPPE